MEQQRKSIDDLFREELGGYAETPPSSAWEAFERKLDAAPPKAGGLFDRWSAYIGAACLLLLLSVTVAIKMNNRTPGTIEATTGSNSANDATNRATSGPGMPAADNSNTKNIADKPGNTSSAEGNNNTRPGGNTMNTAGITNNNNHNTANTSKPLIRTKNHSKGNRKNNYYAANTKHNTGSSAKTTNTYNSSNTNTENDQPATANVYNSSPAAHNGPSAGTEDDAAEKKEVKATPDVPKTENPAAPKPFAKKEVPNKPSRPPFKNFFEAGVKAGYETGFNNDGSKKGVVSGYVEYHISQKFALMLQPAFKAASLNTHRIGTAQSYYKVNGNGTVKIDTTPVPIIPGSETPTLMEYDYHYSQTHDSIVKTYSIGGTYTEMDLPVLLKYNITKKLGIYGGVNIVYSKMIGISGHTYTASNLEKTGDTTKFTAYGATPPPTDPIGSHISYKGNQYPTNYTSPYTYSTTGQFRACYMVGFSYQCTNRLLLDALIQQTSSTTNTQAGYNTNSALAAPYVRFTVGYKLLTK